MILKIVVGVLLIGVLVGLFIAPRLRRPQLRAWRPGVVMLALTILVGATAAAVLKNPAAIPLFLVGILLSMSMRRVSRRPHQPRESSPPPKRGGMSDEEARAILGVGVDASTDDIQAAYLRLIRRAHPDQGGTSGLAAQLNAARDVLLRKK